VGFCAKSAKLYSCHCGLDPQSHATMRFNYEIAGQARNDSTLLPKHCMSFFISL
jgi:hypothetical protein